MDRQDEQDNGKGFMQKRSDERDTLRVSTPPREFLSSSFTAGIARRNVTPAESVWMGGFSFRDHPSESVLRPLWAKVFVLAGTDGDIGLVVVAVDRVGLSWELMGSIEAECAVRFGMARERIIIFCSHTHSGPSDWPSVWMNNDADEIAKVKKYSRWMVGQVVEAVGEALAARQPVSLGFSQGVAGFGVNRRRERPGCRHFPGPVDQDVPVLRVSDAQGKALAIIFGYACHATSLAGYEISGDWPGFACEVIEERHPSAAAFFIPGCGADINPLPRLLPGREVALSRAYGEIMADAVELALPTNDSVKKRPLSGPLTVRRGVAELYYEKLPSAAEIAALRQHPEADMRRSGQHLEALLQSPEGLPASLKYPAWVIRIGDLLWIALSGEVTVDYALTLKERYGWETTWVSAYASPTTAYFPSHRVWEEGGYEAGDCMLRSSHPSRLREDVETHILELVNQLAS